MSIKPKLAELEHFPLEPKETAASRWEQYTKRFDNFLVATNITNQIRQRAMLLHCVGEELFTIFENIPDRGAADDYAACKNAIKAYFQPAKNVEFETYSFRQARQKPDESTDQYHVRLRKLSIHCEFHDVDREIKSQIVQTCRDSEVRQKALRDPNLTLQQLLAYARAREASGVQAKAMVDGHETVIKKVESQNNRSKPKKFVPKAKPKSKDLTCGLCGGPYPHENECPAKGKSCNNCGIMNHYARVCRKSKQAKQGTQAGQSAKPRFSQRHKQHHVGDDDTYGYSNNQNRPWEDTYNLFNTESEDPNKFPKRRKQAWAESPITPYTVDAIINGVNITFEVDTGASKTIVSQDEFDRLRTGTETLNLEPASVKLRTYTGEEFRPSGMCVVPVTYEDQQAELSLLVVPGDRPNLLGRDWMSKLCLKWQTIFETHSVHEKINQRISEIKVVLSKYRDLFKPGLGKVKTKAKLHIDPNVVPVFHKARPVPYALLEAIDKELDRLLALGIIEPVAQSDWAAPIVPVRKPNGQVRICGDFKLTVNQAIRGNQYPIPKIADLYAKLAGGQTFTKIDMSDAYLQMELDDASKELVVINTHRGLFRYNRLAFGISSAPGIFQRTMDNLLQGLDHVVVYLDDILVTGKTAQEHLANLEKVLKRLLDAGWRLREEKCTFNADAVVYLGHRIDKDGLHPVPEKVEAIVKAPPPENIQQLQAYLGMLNYYERFLRNRATVLEPLHELLRKKGSWHWGPDQQKAFVVSKELLQSSKILVHYDPAKEIIVAPDASPYGLGAVLSHPGEIKGQDRPVAYASRSLSSAERNYSQLEKEALALIFAVKKWHQYLWGRTFTLLTDHKPLVGLLHQDKPIPPTAALRIQRWALTLSAYDYKIVYRPGQQNGNADGLSRLPASPPPASPPPAEFIHALDQIDTTVVTHTMIATWTNRHPVLANVRKFILSGWPKRVDKQYQPYFYRRNELTLHEGCILWGARVIVPPQGHRQLLEELHLAHPGMVRMKKLARSYIWWPNLDEDIEQKVKDCQSCQQHVKKPTAAPLHPWEWPGKPWFRLHIDFAGPYEGKMILIIADAHTKYIDAHVLNSATSLNTIGKLKATFAVHGLPHIIVSDNGSNFTSQEFRDFCKSNGIRHIFTAPYHPASNGLAERAVQTIKSGLSKSSKSQSLESRLLEVLFRYRITPHATTGMAPCELLMHRQLRSRLDLAVPDLSSSVLRGQTAMKSRHDRKAKAREFSVDDAVFAKNFADRGLNWYPGRITSRSGPVSYTIRLKDGRVWRRHQDAIRLNEAQEDTSVEHETQPPQVVPIPQREEIQGNPRDSDSVVTRTPQAATPPVVAPPSPSAGPPQQPLRRSSRVSHPPDRLDL
ncbi:uncharacterized protein K02A2.6-like [Lineus longissimus]|uniref:uncharacterized protein K02A2.6-like n=1 Tax=Lineus longissimus TaxID=88925 RepID=UPI00315DEB55